METTVLVQFLSHLSSCAERLLEKEEIELYDVISLRRELSELKRHIDGKERVAPELLDKILGLDIEVDESLLSDSKRSRWFLVVRLLFHRSPLVALERSRRLEKIKRQIADFRDNLDHMRFGLDFTESPTSSSQTPGLRPSVSNLKR